MGLSLMYDPAQNTAWQKQIRDQRAADDSDADMFGRWWVGTDLDLQRTDVRGVSHETARSIIDKYEWLGTMPAIVRFAYGIFFGGHCGGVVVYGDEYGENLGVWDKYGFTGKIICLSRGACVHWTPGGTASRLIRRSMALLPAHYEVITATVDHEAGEVGTIYQACGFHFVRMMRAKQYRYRLEGFTSRSLRKSGLTNKQKIIDAGLVPVREHEKGRYFCFRGPTGAIRKHRRAIADILAPYPKRPNATCPVDEPVPTGASAVQPREVAPTHKESR
jgi:hypothetical protein